VDSANWYSPLANYFEVENFRGVAVDPTHDSERAMRDCMKEKGFEFVPEEPNNLIVKERFADDTQRGTREWIAIYGFGISTLSFTDEEVPGLVGQLPLIGGSSESPNLTIVDSMSPEEGQAWSAAELECWTGVRAALQREVAPMDLSWPLEFEARLEAIVSASDGVLDAGFLDQLARLQAEEVLTALTYWDCGLRARSEPTIFTTILAEREQEFIDQNAALLLSLKQELAIASSG